jgi:Tol biopolymer transport system component
MLEGSRFLSRPTVSLLLLGIDGSDSRVLYLEAGCTVSYHEWTGDGEHIIALVECGESPRILRISVSGGETEVINELDPGRFSGLSLSQDSRYLTYGVAVEAGGGNFDIRLLSLDGGPDLPLVRHPANDQLVGWVPGTDEVLFLSDRDGTEDLWAIRVIDGAPEGPPRMVQRNMGRVDPLGFTSDGTLSYTIVKAVYSTGVAPFDLAAGTVEMESGVGILGNNMPATWSPDGEYLAFVGDGPTLRIHHLDTGMERELASHLWAARNQRWSPDGRFILFSAGLSGEMEEEEREPGLYLVDVESGQTTQVVELNAESGSHPRWELGGEWSKDGTAIIYSLYNQNLGEGRLVWLDLESGEERELFRDPYLASQHFAVSPDGSRLVFALRGVREGNWAIQVGGRLLIMDLDDGDVREFHKFPEEGRVWSLQWTPDGKYVLYTIGEDDGDALWRVPVAGGPAEKTWTFEGDYFNTWANLSPDGRQVAYTTYRWDFEVWVMENFLPAGGEGGR